MHALYVDNGSQSVRAVTRVSFSSPEPQRFFI